MAEPRGESEEHGESLAPRHPIPEIVTFLPEFLPTYQDEEIDEPEMLNAEVFDGGPVEETPTPGDVVVSELPELTESGHSELQVEQVHAGMRESDAVSTAVDEDAQEYVQRSSIEAGLETLPTPALLEPPRAVEIAEHEADSYKFEPGRYTLITDGEPRLEASIADPGPARSVRVPKGFSSWASHDEVVANFADTTVFRAPEVDPWSSGGDHLASEIQGGSTNFERHAPQPIAREVSTLPSRRRWQLLSRFDRPLGRDETSS